jgi:hypothetical protein
LAEYKSMTSESQVSFIEIMNLGTLFWGPLLEFTSENRAPKSGEAPK